MADHFLEGQNRVSQRRTVQDSTGQSWAGQGRTGVANRQNMIRQSGRGDVDGRVMCSRIKEELRPTHSTTEVNSTQMTYLRGNNCVNLYEMES